MTWHQAVAPVSPQPKSRPALPWTPQIRCSCTVLGGGDNGLFHPPAVVKNPRLGQGCWGHQVTLVKSGVHSCASYKDNSAVIPLSARLKLNAACMQVLLNIGGYCARGGCSHRPGGVRPAALHTRF